MTDEYEKLVAVVEKALISQRYRGLDVISSVRAVEQAQAALKAIRDAGYAVVPREYEALSDKRAVSYALDHYPAPANQYKFTIAAGDVLKGAEK